MEQQDASGRIRDTEERDRSFSLQKLLATIVAGFGFAFIAKVAGADRAVQIAVGAGWVALYVVARLPRWLGRR